MTIQHYSSFTPIGVGGSRGNGTKQSTFGVRRSQVKVTGGVVKAPFLTQLGRGFQVERKSHLVGYHC